MENSVRKLNSQQTESFDIEYIDNHMFEVLTQKLDWLIHSKQSLTMLDVGGGNGIYSDKFLAHYPNSQATLVEPEISLLNKNREHPNKKLHCSLFQELQIENNYDIIQFNWVLHHFVGDSYALSQQLQVDALNKAYQHLSKNGLVVIFENFYEGQLLNNLPSKLIYHLTASKALAPITQKLGANTAGVGVCFNSRENWHSKLINAGFHSVIHVPFYQFGNLGKLKSKLLHIEQQNVGLLIGIK